MCAGELVEEVLKFLSIGDWNMLLYIKDLATCNLTLDVLASFNFNRSYNDYSRRGHDPIMRT